MALCRRGFVPTSKVQRRAEACIAVRTHGIQLIIFFYENCNFWLCCTSYGQEVNKNILH